MNDKADSDRRGEYLLFARPGRRVRIVTPFTTISVDDSQYLYDAVYTIEWPFINHAKRLIFTNIKAARRHVDQHLRIGDARIIIVNSEDLWIFHYDLEVQP